MTGRGRAQKTINLIKAAGDILAEIHPATVRAVCYQLFVRELISDMSTKNTNRVSKILRAAREEGTIPWEHIVDETRGAEIIVQYDDMNEYRKEMLKGFRKNFWAQQPEQVEVWSEKGTVRGTLAPIFDEFGIAFRVMHGFNSATSVHDVAVQTAGLLEPLRALYVGDYDPSGLYMSAEDLPKRLGQYGGNVDLRRVALLLETDSGLPSFGVDTKRGDPRYTWFAQNHGRTCWELDALNPNDLRERVRNAVLEYIDQEAWDQCTKIEKTEMESLQRVRFPAPARWGVGLWGFDSWGGKGPSKK